MTRAAFVTTAALLVAVVSILLLLAWPRPFLGKPAATRAGAPAAATAELGRTIKARLFYVSDDGARLTSLEREVPYAEGPEQAREIINAQIALGDPLVSAVPSGTALRAVYLTARGDAYVDLSREAVTAHPGGTLNELLTVVQLYKALGGGWQ